MIISIIIIINITVTSRKEHNRSDHLRSICKKKRKKHTYKHTHTYTRTRTHGIKHKDKKKKKLKQGHWHQLTPSTHFLFYLLLLSTYFSSLKLSTLGKTEDTWSSGVQSTTQTYTHIHLRRLDHFGTWHLYYVIILGRLVLGGYTLTLEEEEEEERGGGGGGGFTRETLHWREDHHKERRD